MIRKIGSFLTLAGFAAFVYMGINYLNNTASFSFLGADFVISEGDPMPIAVAVMVMVFGMMLKRYS